MTRRYVLAIAGFGSLVTMGCLLYAGSPGDPGWWSDVALFLIWALLPYAIVAGCSFVWSTSVAQTLLCVGGVAAIVPVPFLAYDAFAGRRGALNGIVFLFLPVYQLFVVIAFSLAAWWTARREALG